LPNLQKLLSILKECYLNKITADKEKKIKHFFVEMYTNAIKHANVGNFEIEIDCYENEVFITKTDFGTKLPLPIQLLEGLTDEPVLIYNNLFGKKGQHLQIEFFVNNDIQVDPLNMFEHFGLQIIASSVDAFYYQYDTDKKSNIFKTKLFL